MKALDNLFEAWKIFYLRKKRQKSKFKQFQRIMNEKERQKYFNIWLNQAKEKEFENKETDYANTFYRKKLLIKYFDILVNRRLNFI